MTIRNRFTRPLNLAAPLAAAALIAGCGDDDSSTTGEGHEASATPQQAMTEIAEVREGLAAGLLAYEQGDAEKADSVIGDTYLEHFEEVEGPLEQRDEELNEELELLISTEIRQEIKAGADPKAVKALVDEANDELDQAEKALQG
jgi:hypothetical protein